MPDFINVRQYHGDRFVNIVVPVEGDTPEVRTEVLPPPENGELIRGRFGQWVVAVVWPDSGLPPQVTIEYDGPQDTPPSDRVGVGTPPDQATTGTKSVTNESPAE